MKNTSPLYIGIAIIGIIFLIMIIPIDVMLSNTLLSEFQLEYVSLTIKMSLIFMVALAGVYRLKLIALSGLSSEYGWTSKLLNLIPVYLFIIGILGFMGKDMSGINMLNLLLLLFACLSVGFAEEFMFRGFLQPFFIQKYLSKRKGLFKSVLYSAMFFGASHLINLMVNDNIPQVIGQAIYAVLIGFFFGVLVLKTNKLIPLAISHGLINFFFLIGTLPGLQNTEDIASESQTLPSLTEQILGGLLPIIIFLPLFIVGVVVLKKINQDNIQEKLSH